jgi:hypothetical protein
MNDSASEAIVFCPITDGVNDVSAARVPVAYLTAQIALSQAE